MPRIAGTSDAQSRFLRTFHTCPGGPPPDQWPSPAIFRRWLRRPGFKRAFDSLQQTLRIQTEFHLAAAATNAAQRLAADHRDLEVSLPIGNVLSLVRSTRQSSGHHSPAATRPPTPPPEPALAAVGQQT